MFCLLALPQLLMAQTTPAEKEVWQGEQKYWDFRTAGKIDEYMSLWHDEFVGWPTGNARPGGRADIRKRIETELARTRPGSYKAKLEPLSVRVFDDVAVVFYRADTVRVDTAGTSVEAHLGITHTWKRTPQGWKIIAGMSAEDFNK